MKQFWDYMESVQENKELEIQNEGLLKKYAPGFMREFRSEAKKTGAQEDKALFQNFINGIETWNELKTKIDKSSDIKELTRLKELIPLASYIGINDFYKKIKSTEGCPSSKNDLFRKTIRRLIVNRLESI
jgi:hypothetical protein